MLRAAYFAQELLSTFQDAIGEVALSPATGGKFTVTVALSKDDGGVVVWDRKIEGGFPEVKVLKQLIRDNIEPDRHLGHSDKKAEHTVSHADEAAVELPKAIEDICHVCP